MNALKVRLEGFDDQYAHYGNEAQVVLLVDARPKAEVYRYQRKDHLYYAEHEGSVSFYYDDPKNHAGYGGSTFVLPLTGGGEAMLVGPWSSRAGQVNAAGFGPCLDVSLTDDPEAWRRGHTFYSAHITLALAQEAAKLYVHPLYPHLCLAFVRSVQWEVDVLYHPVLVKDSTRALAGKVFDSGDVPRASSHTVGAGTEQQRVIHA